MMTWATRFEAREYLRGSLWVIPLVGAVLGALLGAGLVESEWAADVPSHWQYSSSTASTVLAAIVGAMAALTGFVVTVAVLVVQMATGTFSARYMRLWYRDGMLKVTLAVLVFTLSFSFALLRRVEADFVPNVGVTVAGILVVVSLLLFLVFFDRFIQRLRPVAVAALVAEAGQQTFVGMARAARSEGIRLQTSESHGVAPTLLVRSTRAGAIQAIHFEGLVGWARKHECELVLARAVGDFVPAGAVLLHVHGGTPGTGAERALRGSFALSDERTIQQDPAFAIRIMVDIATRALSPAVNDPTTAVQVINHLGESLRQIGSTDLRLTPDGTSTGPAVVMRVRRWEDFLALGVTEIREYGATSIQVVRRLRAMLDELTDAVLPEHRGAVLDEIARLDATVAETWSRSVDGDLAGVPDHQGIGGLPIRAATSRD